MQPSESDAQPGRRRRAALALLAGLAGGVAEARPASAAKDGRPNILVVMTDDQAAADVAHMPNVRRLLADAGHDVRRRGRLVPALLPGAGDVHHRPVRPQPRRGGQLLPLRLVRDEGPRATSCRPGCRRSGYRTALIGKWLNGYGARDAHGEVPTGLRHLARAARCLGLRLLQLRDEHGRRPQDLGRRRLRAQARRVRQDRGHRQPGPACRASSASSSDVFGPGPYTYWGTEEPEDYSPDVTGRITEELVRARAQVEEAVLHLVGAGRAAPRGRGDDADGPPRAATRGPAPRYEAKSTRYTLPRPPSFNEPDFADKPSNLTRRRAVADRRADRPAAARLRGPDRLAAGGRRPRQDARRGPCAQTGPAAATR